MDVLQHHPVAGVGRAPRAERAEAGRDVSSTRAARPAPRAVIQSVMSGRRPRSWSIGRPVADRRDRAGVVDQPGRDTVGHQPADRARPEHDRRGAGRVRRERRSRPRPRPCAMVRRPARRSPDRRCGASPLAAALPAPDRGRRGRDAAAADRHGLAGRALGLGHPNRPAARQRSGDGQITAELDQHRACRSALNIVRAARSAVNAFAVAPRSSAAPAGTVSTPSAGLSRTSVQSRWHLDADGPGAGVGPHRGDVAVVAVGGHRPADGRIDRAAGLRRPRRARRRPDRSAGARPAPAGRRGRWPATAPSRGGSGWRRRRPGRAG